MSDRVQWIVGHSTAYILQYTALHSLSWLAALQKAYSMKKASYAAMYAYVMALQSYADINFEASLQLMRLWAACRQPFGMARVSAL